MKGAGQALSQPNFQYVRLADEIEEKIKQGIYKAGDKLPSLRKLHDRTGFSITTVYQAYIELEKRDMVEPRLKSGFYVKAFLKKILPVPKLKKHAAIPQKISINALSNSIVESMSDPTMLQLGGASPSSDLLPIKQLFRTLKTSKAQPLIHAMIQYEYPAGSLELRRQIAKRSFGLGSKISEDDIIITNGCMEAVYFCLRAVAGPGDTILVESPAFHFFLQVIEDLNMFALEVQSDPEFGINVNSVEKALNENNVAACIFNPTFNNPLGYSMTPEDKKDLVELLNGRNIPIIEDDIYGELYFGKTKPSTLKSFDKKGLVLYCSSFSKALAGGLRVGWTLPGQFKDKVKHLKLNVSVASPGLNQLIVSDFLKTGAFDRHLRKIRNALKNQVSTVSLAIARHFPAGTEITAPKGGLLLWVQLDESVDSLKIYHKAAKQSVSILPGSLFSSSGKYNNCIRLSCGYPWSEKVEKGLGTLAGIISEMTGK